VRAYSRLYAPSSAVEGALRRTGVKLTNRALRALPQRWPVITYELDGFPLRIPLSHPLPRILATDSRYLEPLRTLVQALRSVGIEAPAVDIGANVGDTACMIAQEGLTEVLCVEGNNAFLPMLRVNAQTAARFGWRFDVTDRYVTTSGQPVREVTRGGTAWLESSCESEHDASGLTHNTMGVDELFGPLDEISLVKIDTDGMDLPILDQILIERRGRILHAIFIEYTPGRDQLSDRLSRLEDAGFDTVYVYDHGGNLICSLDVGDRRLAEQLSAYAAARRAYFDLSIVSSTSPVGASLETVLARSWSAGG
jgi:FkbM family methyltransferase